MREKLTEVLSRLGRRRMTKGLALLAWNREPLLLALPEKHALVEGRRDDVVRCVEDTLKNRHQPLGVEPNNLQLRSICLV
jgi:hypothetical protein